VYGSARISDTWTDTDDSTNITTGDTIEGSDSWDVKNESSRLGFRGSEDLGNGLAAIYHYEFGVDASDTADIGGTAVGGRLSYVGLTGGFGQISIGRQWNPYYFAVGGEVDVFNGVGSSLGYYNNDGFTRSGNLLVYMTPSFNGLVGAVAIENDGEAGEDNVDRYQVAATYDNGPLFLGAAWRQTDTETVSGDPDGDDLDQYGVQARYNIGFFGLAASWQRQDDGTTETDGYDVVGSFGFGNNTLRLGYFDVEDNSDGWIVGLQHNLSKRSRLWIEYNDEDSDQNNRFTTNTDGDILEVADRANLSIGMRHAF
jgi:predicted porin